MPPISEFRLGFIILAAAQLTLSLSAFVAVAPRYLALPMTLVSLIQLVVAYTMRCKRCARNELPSYESQFCKDHHTQKTVNLNADTVQVREPGWDK